MSNKKSSTPEKPDGIIIGGQTMIGDDGRFQSGVSKMAITDELMEAILAHDVKEIADPAASFVQSEDITMAVLAKDKKKKFSPDEHGMDGHADEEHDGVEDRPFVGGGNWDYKWKPANINEVSKDPMGIRTFIGDEFPRMLAYSPPKIEQQVVEMEGGFKQRIPVMVEKGVPAFWSHWPEGTKPEDMKVIKVNIATQVPNYMKKGTIAAAMDGRRDFAFNGQSLEETFTPITDKIESAWRRYAEDFEKTYGIKLDVRRDDAPDAHKEKDVNISVLGFGGGNERLAGFASFPGGMNKWPQFQALGHDKGFMMLNDEYCNSPNVSEHMLYDLILHEMGHFFGWVHPHDLGAMRMSQGEALNSTAMAYTDGQFAKFDGQEGVTAGVVELSFRDFMANPPKINTENGAVYDLEKRNQQSGGENWQSRVMKMTGMMPAVPILCNGTGTVLKGTRNSDVLDTEPGHMSRVKNPIGVEQRFALVEGHIAKVYGRGGNNHIFTSSRGSQEIYPGPGENQIHIYEAGIGNEKTIFSTGRDTLVLHQDIFLQNPDLKVSQSGKDIIFENETGSIVLRDQLQRDKGVVSIKIIDDEGRDVLVQDVSRFHLNGFVEDIIEPMKRHGARLKEAEKEAQAEAQIAKNVPENKDKSRTSRIGNDNQVTGKPARKEAGFAERLRQKDEQPGLSR